MPHCFLRTIRNYEENSVRNRHHGMDTAGPLLTTRSGRVIRRPTASGSGRVSRRGDLRPRSWNGLPIVTRYHMLQGGSRLQLMEEQREEESLPAESNVNTEDMKPDVSTEKVISHPVLQTQTLEIDKEKPPESNPSLPVNNLTPQIFNCVQCNRVFASLAAYNAHQRVHYKPTKYLCPYCPKVFARSWLLKGHLRVHTGERPFRCHHEGCNKAFADRSNLRAHELIHTQSSKRWKCPVCSKLFAQKRYLHKHLTEVCKGAAGRKLEAVLVQVSTH